MDKSGLHNVDDVTSLSYGCVCDFMTKLLEKAVCEVGERKEKESSELLKAKSQLFKTHKPSCEQQ